MAMICKSGSKECTGCMSCYSEPEPVYCDICGKECEELYYDKYNEVVGCDRCIIRKLVDDID
jgi:hypothetical protein